MIDFLGTLQDKGEKFADVVAAGDLDAPVPCCPDWALRDLAVHQGRVWEWARSCVEAGKHVDESADAISDDALVPWLSDQLQRLVPVLRAADPDAPTWTFGPKPRTVGFWWRRQAHEVAVHLWDAQSAVGGPLPIEAALASDGVDEVLTVILPRQVRLDRMDPVEEGVRVRLPDGRAYDLGERIVAEVTGDPSDLLLALWHRAPIEALTVTGDVAAAHRALDRALTP